MKGIGVGLAARRLAFAAALIVLTELPALGSPGGTIEGTLDGLGKGPFVVYVEQIPGTTYPPGNPPPVMNQRSKTYVPHVLPVVAGSKVEFLSEDKELHNVYAWALASKTSPFNISIIPGMPPHVYYQSFPGPGVVRLTCNVHKEMLAFIVVLQNPYFATVESGSNIFRLADVPPGKYNLRVWSEKADESLLAKKFPVDVTAGATAKVSIAQGGQKS